MKKLVSVFALLALLATYSVADDDRSKELERVDNSTKVLNEILAAPDKGIPEEILSGAECVAVVPSMIKAGFVVGGRYGKGVATCRNGNKWSAPAPIRIEGGSYGLQIGGQAVDLVMLVMNERGMRHLLQSKFQIGADASAAAGPVGRHAEAATNWKLQSEILTYSRSRGAFAGITLNGAVVKQDEDDTAALYGRDVTFERILRGQVPPPAGTQQFLATVSRHFKAARTDDNENARMKTSGSQNASSKGASSTGGVSGTAASTSTDRSTTSQTTQESSAVGSNTSSGNTANSSDKTAASGSSGNMTSASNDDVRSAIDKSLRDEPGLSSSNVAVNVTADTVEVSGTVPSQEERNRVLSVVGNQAGNRRVVDRDLKVK